MLWNDNLKNSFFIQSMSRFWLCVFFSLSLYLHSHFHCMLPTFVLMRCYFRCRLYLISNIAWHVLSRKLYYISVYVCEIKWRISCLNDHVCVCVCALASHSHRFTKRIKRLCLDAQHTSSILAISRQDKPTNMRQDTHAIGSANLLKEILSAHAKFASFSGNLFLPAHVFFFRMFPLMLNFNNMEIRINLTREHILFWPFHKNAIDFLTDAVNRSNTIFNRSSTSNIRLGSKVAHSSNYIPGWVLICQILNAVTFRLNCQCSNYFVCFPENQCGFSWAPWQTYGELNVNE